MSELSLPDRLGGGAYTWRAPRWLPIGGVVLAILWGAGVWWLVSNVSSGPTPTAAASEQGAAGEVAVLRAKVDSLAQQTGALAADRDALARRVAALEARPATSLLPATTAAPAPEASQAQQLAVVPMALGAAPAEYSVPRFAYRTQAPAPPTPSAAPGAASPGAAATPSASPVSRFFTNGADSYNCTSFTSQAESQEALAVNAPGDPNRLDMNGNGVACEDIAYPVGTPRNVTPIPNR